MGLVGDLGESAAGSNCFNILLVASTAAVKVLVLLRAGMVTTGVGPPADPLGELRPSWIEFEFDFRGDMLCSDPALLEPLRSMAGSEGIAFDIWSRTPCCQDIVRSSVDCGPATQLA